MEIWCLLQRTYADIDNTSGDVDVLSAWDTLEFARIEKERLYNLGYKRIEIQKTNLIFELINE